MTAIRTWKRGVTLLVLIVIGGGAAIWAQTTSDGTGGSLAALTAEVRQLRAAVEEAARSQTQTQALGVYLSAEQSRLVQLGARLEAVRNDLGGATMRSRDAAWRLTAAQQEAAQAQNAADRAEAASMVQMFKDQADQAAEQEQQLHLREADLSQAMQAEEARWADLIVRLEQQINKK